PVGENSQIIGLLRYSPIHHWLDRLQAFRFTLSLFSRKWDAPGATTRHTPGFYVDRSIKIWFFRGSPRFIWVRAPRLMGLDGEAV
ncbi:MAG: hypothetical protein VKJ85_03035, partial [Prochlorothrix sp.]|nr:hypothetical protein [Prochlorothrix sp.]